MARAADLQDVQNHELVQDLVAQLLDAVVNEVDVAGGEFLARTGNSLLVLQREKERKFVNSLTRRTRQRRRKAHSQLIRRQEQSSSSSSSSIP